MSDFMTIIDFFISTDLRVKSSLPLFSVNNTLTSLFVSNQLTSLHVNSSLPSSQHLYRSSLRWEGPPIQLTTSHPLLSPTKQKQPTYIWGNHVTLVTWHSGLTLLSGHVALDYFLFTVMTSPIVHDVDMPFRFIVHASCLLYYLVFCFSVYLPVCLSAYISMSGYLSVS